VLKQALQAGFEFVRFFLICGENFVRFLVEKFSSFFGVACKQSEFRKRFCFSSQERDSACCSTKRNYFKRNLATQFEHMLSATDSSLEQFVLIAGQESARSALSLKKGWLLISRIPFCKIRNPTMSFSPN